MTDPVPAAARRQLWIDLGIVAGVGAAARLLLLALAPGTLIFPDSFSYIEGLFRASNAVHTSDLSYFWWVGSLGTYSADSIAAFQMVFGLLCGVALVDGLRRVAPRWIALSCGLLFVCFPPLLGFERVFLSEPTCVDLAALGLFGLIRLLTTRSSRAQWGWTALVAASMGSLVVVRSALLFAALAVIAVSVLIAARSLPRIWWRRAALACVTLVIFAAPLLERSEANQRYFQTRSLAPASAAFLFARWAPLIPCPTPGQDLTPAARRDMARACTMTSYGQIPGGDTNNLWGGQVFPKITSRRTAEDRLTQSQLGAAARSAMLHHPGAVAQQVVASIWYQLFSPPSNDLRGYHAAVLTPRLNEIVTQHQATGRILERFFGDKVGDRKHVPPVRGLLQATYRWPQYLLWVDLALGLVVGLASLLLRRRPSKAWLGSPQVLVGITAVAFCAGEMLNIALGAFSVFRYLFPLVPWLIGLLALGLSAAAKLVGRTRSSGSGRARTSGGA